MNVIERDIKKCRFILDGKEWTGAKAVLLFMACNKMDKPNDNTDYRIVVDDESRIITSVKELGECYECGEVGIVGSGCSNSDGGYYCGYVVSTRKNGE